jgi:hypothetical protein
MQNWFECKIRYTKIDEKTGKEKKVTEPYLVDAISFTEAETRIFKEMEACISGDFTVVSIRRSNYSDIVTTDGGEKWYKGKVTFMTIDESVGKEKKVSINMLVLSISINDADAKIKESLKGMTVDFESVSISETPIIDIFPYLGDKLSSEN